MTSARLPSCPANPLMKRAMTPALIALAVSLASSGCISTEQTVYQDQERVKVEFENDTAGRLFYEALSQMRSREHRAETRTSVSIPVVFEHKRHVVQGESVTFNQAVRRCDTNGDGRITEQEARIFKEATDSSS